MPARTVARSERIRAENLRANRIYAAYRSNTARASLPSPGRCETVKSSVRAAIKNRPRPCSAYGSCSSLLM
jgi:hypothetical protein